MIYLLTTFLLILSNVADGDWKTISEDARILSEQGYHAESARSYEKAWLSAESQTALLVAAGEEYLQARLYADAARVFEEAMLDGSTADHLQYKLGMALKGDGQYAAAIAMLMLQSVE